jgi:hypothetical protein
MFLVITEISAYWSYNPVFSRTVSTILNNSDENFPDYLYLLDQSLATSSPRRKLAWLSISSDSAFLS